LLYVKICLLKHDLKNIGLVRPKVLILLPFRESARRVVDLMIKLLFSKDSTSSRGASVLKKKRFDDEFGTADEADAISGGRKPEDFYQTFAGNTDDGFKVRWTS
jgi:U3 small nucleolar RNA-associated protein 25